MYYLILLLFTSFIRIYISRGVKWSRFAPNVTVMQQRLLDMLDQPTYTRPLRRNNGCEVAHREMHEGVVVRLRDGLHNSRVWCATRLRHYAGISVTRNRDIHDRGWKCEVQDTSSPTFATRSRYQMLFNGELTIEFFVYSWEPRKQIVSTTYFYYEKRKHIHHLWTNKIIQYVFVR